MRNMWTRFNINISRFALILSLAICFSLCGDKLLAQKSKAAPYPYDALTFKENVHDFGKFSEKDGPKSCSFEFVNEREVPVKISKVSSFCSCTTVKWPKKAIKPGKTGKVVVTYRNDEGPKPFDKQLKVYYEGNADYEILRVRGRVTKAPARGKAAASNSRKKK